MIVTLDGKLHHLKEVDFLERMLAKSFDMQKFYADFTDFLKNQKFDYSKGYLEKYEVESIDGWIKNYLYPGVEEARTVLVRAFIVGELLAFSDLQRTVFRADISRLPKAVIDAVQEYNLTLYEAQALNRVVERGANYLTSTTESTIQQVKQAVFEAIAQNQGRKGIEDRMLEMTEDTGELVRDWQRVSVTETNIAFTDGYIASMSEGDFVIGFSMPDACSSCIRDINGKIYRVRKDAPSGDDESAEWKWNNEVWVGKSNVGRSSSPRKRIVKELGNREDNLVGRSDDEISKPTIPYHPRCRCRWIVFYPDQQFIDEKGNIRLKSEDPQKWRGWYDEGFKPVFGER